ncbi:MAG: AbrB/MazE/SpoVT family DNA-binding domain-containing protein [Verrucomicrobiota bacterium]
METAIVNEKGQITIPSKMRKNLDIQPGQQVRLFPDPDGTYFSVSKTGSISDAFGILPKPDKASTIEEMDHSVQNAVAEHVMNP